MNIMDALRRVTERIYAKMLQKLDGKVDKVAGKGLSTEDFTSAEKAKLAAISELETNVPSDVVRLGVLQPKLPEYGAWGPVAYGADKFVALMKDSRQAAYSVDGIKWVPVTLPALDSWQSVAYGGGIFVAVAMNSATAIYSSDGITWRTSLMPNNYAWTSVAYGQGYFIAVAAGQSVCAISYDGSSWSLEQLPTTAEWSDISYDGNRFVIVAYNNYIVVTGFSYNWTMDSHPAPSWSLISIASNDNGHSVALGRNGSGEICWTPDGDVWYTTDTTGRYWCDVIYGNNKFVMIAKNDNIAAFSDTGELWTEVTLPSTEAWTNIAYGDGLFVIVSESSDVCAVSADGINWGDIGELIITNGDGLDVTADIAALLGPKTTNITILADGWAGDESPYTQSVTVDGVAANSRIDLYPTFVQIAELQSVGAKLTAQNDNGIITIYAIDAKPDKDYTIQATITAVNLI